MKSLLQFVAARQTKRAVKFSSAMPRIEACVYQVGTPTGLVKVTFELLHLPLYFAGQLERLVADRAEP